MPDPEWFERRPTGVPTSSTGWGGSLAVAPSRWQHAGVRAPRRLEAGRRVGRPPARGRRTAVLAPMFGRTRGSLHRRGVQAGHDAWRVGRSLSVPDLQDATGAEIATTPRARRA